MLAHERLCLVRPAGGERSRRSVVMDVGDLVRIGQAIEELEAALRPAVGLVEVEADERRSRPRPVGVGQQNRIVESLGKGDRLLRQLGVVLPHRLGDEGSGLRGAAGIRELERSGEPALDQAVVERTLPHPAAHGRFERELPVQLGERLGALGQLDRLLHRRPHGLAVELQSVHPADRVPHLGVARRELGGAVKLREGVVEIEARQRELGGAPQPAQRRRRELPELFLAVPPGELRDAGSDRLRVVVRQHAGAAVRRVVRLEPAREGGVQARAARLRQAAVRDVAGERVLEDELGFRGADEAALHEGAHLGARAGQRGQASPE